ncbi:hypothetical protein [Agrobacterium burrii]|uniref:Uncharacterized protein n=1 Tax=Agrobacterium burrii TaxID=2815339 RepID=A0ABS3EG20_9HYPH|nr:hypothetical protein [Agrobacterium burrii]MBO0130910.1 hypothetical protein [Agrobacterium burrii]
MNFLNPENIGPVPVQSTAPKSTSVWLEETLFGHRLWYRQTPWLLFLEFLNVAEAFLRGGKEQLFAYSDPTEMRAFKMRYRMGLRHILFDNEELVRASQVIGSEEARWAAWFSTMNGRGVDGGFGYLKERFRQFSSFVELVSLVKQTTLENDNERRWSSQFIFPFGPDALYSDTIIKKESPQPDYNNFGRTGEILYMMISRSAHADRLRSYFADFLDPEKPKNQLVKTLGAPSDAETNRDNRGETYLPYRTHPSYDRLAEDWLAVLELQLPEQDAYAYLVPLGSFHIMLYQLETAAALAGRQRRPVMVCEMIAPKREFVRQRAIASYQENDSLSLQALDHAIDKSLAGDEWKEIESADVSDGERFDAAKDFIARHFYFKPEEGEQTVQTLVDALRESVVIKHEANCGKVHSDYGRSIGLCSRRGTNRYRYAPTDAFIKMLVITLVSKRTEFKKFLADVYARYGLVFGETEAADALEGSTFQSSAFERNRTRLEVRLASMGLLNRLSDGCAYVINPFAANGTE